VRPDSLGLRDAVQRARHQLGDTHVLDDDIVTAAEESAEAAEETDLVVDDRANVDPSEHAHLSRLELASTLNGRDLFWSFAVPAGVTALAALILVQFWAAIWVYGLILAASLVAGSAWYVGAHYWRRRRAKSVRSTRQQASYDDIAVLVKKADTDDVTCYYGWVGGTVYADYNELRLAWTLSEVAHAHIEGEPIPPTIQQSSRATSSSTSRIWRGTRRLSRRPKSATG